MTPPPRDGNVGGGGVTGVRWLSLRIEEASSKRAQKVVVHIGISKRVAPKAVSRNRVKRLIREALRRRIQLDSRNLYRVKVEKVPAELNYARVESAIVEIFK